MRTAGSAWITGASGFVGRQLSGHLRRTGWQVATARLRHGEYAALPKAGDVVFHAAALAHRRGHALPAFMGANCELALDLYQQASDAGAAGFVFLSTAKVLGESSAGTEAALPIDAPRRPHGPYAESKAAAEERLLAAWRQRRLALAIVRPPLVYGPGRARQLPSPAQGGGTWPTAAPGGSAGAAQPRIRRQSGPCPRHDWRCLGGPPARHLACYRRPRYRRSNALPHARPPLGPQGEAVALAACPAPCCPANPRPRGAGREHPRPVPARRQRAAQQLGLDSTAIA